MDCKLLAPPAARILLYFDFDFFFSLQYTKFNY